MMSKLLTLITGNPAVLVWLTLAAFALGLGAGAAPVWYVRGLQVTAPRDALDSERTKYASFAAQVKSEGEAATRAAAAKAASDKLIKESSDAVTSATIDNLRADADRLHNARASTNSGSGYVPRATPGTARPDLACYDRAELNAAIQQFDVETSGIVEQGDEATIKLNGGRTWVHDVLSSPTTPAGR